MNLKFVAILLLLTSLILLAGCSSAPTPSPIPPAPPAPDIEATVEAKVEAVLTAVPTATPRPETTVAYVATPDPPEMESSYDAAKSSPEHDPATTPGPEPTPTPTPTAAPATVTPTPVPSSPTAIPGEPTLTPSLCVDNASPIFTNHITDLQFVSSIVNLGMVSDNNIAQHTYVHPLRPGDSEVSEMAYEDRKIPIYAPMEGKIAEANWSAPYDPVTDSVKVGEDGQYLLYLQVSCQVTIRLAHVAGVVDKLAERLPSTPKFGDSRTDDVVPPVKFEAGEQIGWFLIGGDSMDFGLFNTEHVNEFINQGRYKFFQQPLHADCPYDYFQESLRSQYYALFGTPWFTMFPDSHCGTASRDLAGTIAGQWFHEPWPPSGVDPDEAQDGGEMAVAIGTHRDGEVAIGGPSFHLKIKTNDTTYADPTTVTTQHCYSYGGQSVFLKVMSDDRLAVAILPSECPDSMPDEYTTYYR